MGSDTDTMVCLCFIVYDIYQIFHWLLDLLQTQNLQQVVVLLEVLSLQ